MDYKNGRARNLQIALVLMFVALVALAVILLWLNSTGVI